MSGDFRQLLLGDSATAVEVANLHRYYAIHVRCQGYPLPVAALPSSINTITPALFSSISHVVAVGTRNPDDPFWRTTRRGNRKVRSILLTWHLQRHGLGKEGWVDSL